MRKLLLCVAAGLALAAVPTAAASPTVRLAIVHVMRGCHVWATDSKTLGPSRTITLARGARLEIRDSCPMAFDVVQTAGRRLAIGDTRWQPGTSRTIVFGHSGVYRLVAKNVKSSDEMGLATLGPDNTLVLTIRVP